MAEQDLVDVGGADPGILERFICGAHDQTFNGLGVEFSKRGVGPPDDAGGHAKISGDGLSGTWPRESLTECRQAVI